MSHRTRVWVWIGGSVSLLLVTLLVGGLEVIRSAWFATYVGKKIISVTEEASGGRAELGTFVFDWRQLRARVTHFVLHGKESPESTPLLTIEAIEFRLNILPSWKRTVDLQYLGIQKPVANIIVLADGTTNIPQPKVPSHSNKSALEAIVNLAIGRFDLNQGSVTFAEQKVPIAAHGTDLRAQLLFDNALSIYRGDLSFTSTVTQSGRPPVKAMVRIPVTIGKDRVGIEKASLSTTASSVTVTASMTNPQHPMIEAHVVAHVSLAEVTRATGIAPGACLEGRPCFADADIDAHTDEHHFAISKAAIALGGSRLNASGNRDSTYIEGKLIMEELCGVFRLPAGHSIGDIQLEGRVQAGNDRIDLQALRIDVLGGHFIIDGSLANYRTFRLHGAIGGFEIAELERRFLSAKQGYDGTIGGTIDASGDLTKPGTSGIIARTDLAIFPAPLGVPLKGHIDADYDAAANLVKLTRIYISLPHSLLQVSGVLGSRLNADFVTGDAVDLFPAMDMVMKNPPRDVPLTLTGGRLHVHAQVDGPLSSAFVVGQVNADRFAWDGRTFDRLSASLTASGHGFAVENGSLSRGTLQANFTASAGLHNWTLTGDQPIKASAELRNAQVPDLLALAGQSAIPSAGSLNASLQAGGTAGNPLGTASLSATDGSLNGEPFRTLELQVAMSDQLVRLTSANWIGPAGTVQASGTYTHPRDNLLQGTLGVGAISDSVRLNAVTNLSKRYPGIDGSAQLNLSAEASIHQNTGNTKFSITSIRGDLHADNVHNQTRRYGHLSAHADTNRSIVSFRADSDLSGSATHLSGQTLLANDYPTTADVSVQHLSIDTLPFDLGIPMKGMIALNGHGEGTLHNPNVTAQLTFTRGTIDGQPIDRLQMSGRYTPQLIEVSSLQVSAAAGSAILNGSFTHPSNQLSSGTLRLHVASGDLRLERLALLKGANTLGGTFKVSMDLAGDLKTINGQRELAPSQVDASAVLTGLTYRGRAAGNAKLLAKTTGGTVSFLLDSDVARCTVHAQGEAKLTADYPITAQFSARDLHFSNFRPFLNLESIAPQLEATAELHGSISGSLRKLDELRGDLSIPSFAMTTDPKIALALRNEGPIELQLDRSIVTVRSAHIVGSRGTDIAITGTAGLKEATPLNLTMKANADLGMLQDVDRDFYSSGTVSLDASLRGSVSAPVANGSFKLKNASVNMIGISNGVSNANGTILFNGSSATIQSLTGESGGGKITLSGFAGFTNRALRYSLHANANRVRTRQQGVSVVNNAALTISGTSRQSLIAGTVTVVSVGINPQSDLGSILSSSTAAQGITDQVSPFLSNSRLDVKIRTAPNVRFQSTLAEDLQAEADLNLVGTLSDPGMTGRVVVTEGDLIFFGNEYKVNHGVISFYNPLKIEPRLNVSLETTVQSIDVVLTLTGSMDNLKLSYRSDPPIQFEEIVALLAVGRRPTSDPTIVANETPQPQQSVGQMGETAIVSQAIASPVSSRLERVFGVTQLKIDPTFASGSALPQASLTLQQRVANNVTFTYTQDYSQANSELVRVEWTLSPRFSAVATRDINGIFGVDFFTNASFVSKPNLLCLQRFYVLYPVSN